MRLLGAVLLLVFLATVRAQVSGSNACTTSTAETYYEQSRYTTSCGFFGWSRCTRYRHRQRTRYVTTYFCCTGYTADGSRCIPICNGVGGDAGCNAPYGRCASPSSCVCNLGYYGDRCHVCPSLPYCTQVQCTTPSDVTCHTCNGQGSRESASLFWPVQQGKVCRATCSHNNHWCWPGQCPDQLSSSCQCTSGFEKIHTDNVETKCELTTTPTIQSCKLQGISDTTVITKSGSPASCQNEDDVYLNFVPRTINVTLHAHLNLPVNQSVKPAYIHDSSFGLSGGSVDLIRKMSTGVTSPVLSQTLGGVVCDRPFGRSTPTPDLTGCSVQFSSSSVSLSDGDWLCATLEARASGFLRYQNFDRTTISDKQLYRETSATRQLCLRYDSSAPTHCSISRVCNSRPIRVGEHVTNSANVHVTVSGWTDPVPTSADSNRASGIEKMTLTLHHVTHASMSQLLVSHDALTTLDVTNGTGDVILPREPALYALELEVKDRAHNVRVARTLVLFDNSSRLEVKSDRKINVTTASWRERGFWQTTGSEFCFSWTGRFYNTFHSESNFLLPLKPDPRGLVSGPYEHPGPLLPTNGTPNVDGVTSFSYNVRVNSASVQGETTLGEVQGQAACFTRATDDGDFVQMTVTATDVMGHVKSDLVGMHVDRSAPEVSLVSRATGLENSLYVHGVRDLSSLQVRLEALDPHSGLVNLRWTLGHRESPGNIANGTWPSHRLANGTTCPASTPCYCPIVGACEFYNYTLSMERLLHDADHNRDYVFTVMAENVAGLRTEVRLGILVDISPPEPGTVLEGEGPAAAQDLDFTSSDFIHVRWSGFLDHESGVFKYRVGVGPRCLTEEELSADLTSPSRGNTSSVQEVMGTVARFSLNVGGKFYASVIAYNKALMTSRAVCSDGFVRDITPPAFHNVTIRGVGTRERIACLGGGVYLLQRNATLVKLETPACSGKCQSPSNTPWLEVLPLANPSQKNAEASTTICNTYSELFGTQPSLYIPNDNVFLDWDLQEEESQIQELQVGFGTSASSPDLEDFHAAFSHRRYHRNHVGLPTATPLYLFLKAVNKAGLVADVTVGPLVVDETPPHVRRPFSVSTNSSTALLVVDPSDFMDEDEDVNLLDCVVRVGYGGGTLIQTPGHPLPRGVCPGSVQGSSRCYTASLAGMRQLAGEEVQDFSFLVEVHDLAGHVATTKSETFQAPSLLPPGHGRVYDLDPSNPVPAEDVDFQMSSSQVCVGWDGFRSHDDVSLFVGVGTTAGKDNVKSFSLVQSSLSQTCLSGLHLQPHTHYVTTVKAVSLVGATLVSGDGFVVLTPSSFPSLLVRDGLGCGEKEKTSLTTVPGDKKTSTATAANLHPGLTYTLVSDGGLAFNVSSSDVVWIPSSRAAVSSAKSFLALSRAATFLVDSTNTSLKLIECHEDREYTWQNSLSGYWNTLGSLTILPTHFSVSLRKNICAAKELTGACMDILTGFEDVGNTFRHTFPEMTLTADSTYHVAVRPCFGHLCGDASLSNGVQFHPHPASSAAVVLSQEVLNSSCFSVSLHWEPFHCGTIAAPYYHVTLKEVDGSNGQQTVFLSRGVTVINQSDRNIKSECWTRPASSVWAVRGCVWGVCPSGQEVTTCHLLTPEPNPTPLYDLDAKKRSPHDAISRHGNEGSDARASRLRMEDVDFLQSRVTLGAVLDQNWQGAVDWFLMVGSAVPGGKCDADLTCVHRTSTSAKTVVLQEMTLQDGQRYRICARRSIPGHSDNQTAATTCSDGFRVDDVPPAPPELRVVNAENGFLSSQSVVHLQWSDVIDLDLSGREAGASGVASVAFSVGSVEGGTDTYPMTTTLASSAIMRNLSLSNGLAYYATIKVTDRVGLARTVSRKFVVDTTGPTLGHVTTGNQEGYVMSDVTELRWSGFRDAESGLRHFRVNVSSSGGNGDVFPATTFHESSATLMLRHLVDGHRYKLAVSAVNGAGLTTTLISDVIADTSPPSPGFVKAELQTLGAGTKVLASWNRFQDSHSGVAEYRAGLGSRPATADLEPLAYMGLRQAMTWQRSLQSGQELYVIVEACNGAGLCVTSSSLPLLVDTSPPLPGSVHVGPPGRPSHFIHDSSMLTAQWFNFQDPHSGIDRYQWCVGTSPTKCDVTSYADHYLMTSLLRGNISLPVNTDLYLQVRAFNKVGLSCVGVSDRFRVDITAPVFLSPPVFLNPYSADSIVIEQQWEDSVFVVDWKVTDEDSPLVSQHLTMWAHGSIRIHDSLSEFGVGRLGPYVILPDSQVRLAPGDDVRINVTACNAAGLCARAASQSLLVDPTPPTVGGFRQEMTWTSTSTTAKVNLSWYGFEDAESSIRRVHVRVGRGYSDSILLGGTVVIDNRDNGTFTLTAGIAAGELLVLTIWAENGVGLISDVAKVTVEVIASVASGTHGFLLIQRHSCDPHFCTGDCTCAVVGGKCPALSGNSSCREDLSREDIMVSLTPTRGASAATASSSCLWGQWDAMSGVQRFEWSAGLETPGGQPVYGDGVFRPATEPVWHDVGLLTSFRHCLPSDRSLRHSGRYVVYVRAWYSASSYHVFTSSPLTVDRTPPTLRSATFVSAAFVHVTSSKDRRYESGELQVSWPRLFSDSHSNITDFDVMVGSHSAGDDVVAALNVGSRTNYKTNVTLHEGVPHHVTVVARNGVGLMTSHSAPPLLLDDEPPIPGVVFTSADYHDAHAQSDTSSVGASWHGFLDQHSAIADYQVAVVNTQMGPPSPSDFRSVGMETNVIIDNLSLRHGHVYRVHVRAVDSAGHVSEAAVSSEIRVDGTPAQAATCSNYRLVATLVLRGASGPNSTPTQLDVSLGHPSSVNGSSGGVVLRLTGQEMYRLTFTGRAHLDHGDRLTLQLDPVLRPLPRDHVSSITLSPMTDEELIVLPPRGDTSWMGIVNVTQCPPSDVTTTSDASKAVKLSMTSPRGAHVTVHVRDPESGVKRVMIGLGTMEGGFQIQPLKTISGHVILLPPGLPHATPIYVTAYVENGARQSSTFASYRLLDLTPPEIVIHKVKVVLETNSQSSKIVISGDWDVQDEESDVTGCLHSVGSGHGSTSLMDWSSLPSTGGSLQTAPLSAHHGDTLYITLWCWNSLGLDTRVTSDPLPVYLHAPISSTALVEIVADNVYSVTPEPRMQPAGGIVRMRWEGFEGDDVIGYQCTLSRDGEVLLNWTDAGLKNHISLHAGHMQEDTTMQITGQVRSYNKNGQKSPPVTATLTISTRIPQLTGKSMRANLTSPSSLLLDWTDVFVLPDQQVAHFTLALGRLRGASDLLPPTSVSGLTYVFPVPSHSRLRSFHAFLRATLPSGASSSYTGVALV